MKCFSNQTCGTSQTVQSISSTCCLITAASHFVWSSSSSGDINGTGYRLFVEQIKRSRRLKLTLLCPSLPCPIRRVRMRHVILNTPKHRKNYGPPNFLCLSICTVDRDFSGSDNNGRGFRHCILSCRAEHTSQVRKKVSGEEKARVMEQFGNIFITAYWKSLVPLCTCAALFLLLLLSPLHDLGCEMLALYTVVGYKRYKQEHKSLPLPSPKEKKKLVVWFLCCGALCAAEGKHDRQQGCNFDTSFVRRRQTNLLARLLSVFFLYLSPQFGSDCWPCMKEWKIGAPIGTSKVIHLPFLNFFLFFLSSSPLRRIYFQGQS